MEDAFHQGQGKLEIEKKKKKQSDQSGESLEATAMSLTPTIYASIHRVVPSPCLSTPYGFQVKFKNHKPFTPWL